MTIVVNAEEMTEFLSEVFPQVEGMFSIDRLDEEVLVMRLHASERHLRPGGTVSGPAMFALADVGAYVTEVLSAMPIVQSFGQERREGERFAGVVERTFDSAKRRILLRAAMTSIVIVLIFYVSSRALRAMDAHVESALAEDSGQPSFALPR